MNGADIISAERERQIHEEGYSAGHDAAHDYKDLLDAASCYLWSAQQGPDGHKELEAPAQWPWDKEYWKPKTRFHDMKRCGALVAAALDRFLDQHAEEHTEQEPDGRGTDTNKFLLDQNFDLREQRRVLNDRVAAVEKALEGRAAAIIETMSEKQMGEAGWVRPHRMGG